MRIKVKSKDFKIHIILPTRLIFSKTTLWLANRFGRKYAAEAMTDISPEALDSLFAEFRRIKNTRGNWELVEVHSAEGDEVHITL